MGILEELGKAALQGVAKGIEQHQKQQALQQQQAQMQQFAANEQAIINAAEQGNFEAVQCLAIMYYKQRRLSKCNLLGSQRCICR